MPSIEAQNKLAVSALNMIFEEVDKYINDLLLESHFVESYTIISAMDILQDSLPLIIEKVYLVTKENMKKITQLADLVIYQLETLSTTTQSTGLVPDSFKFLHKNKVNFIDEMNQIKDEVKNML
jgi:hypothetical protein